VVTPASTNFGFEPLDQPRDLVHDSQSHNTQMRNAYL